MDEAMNVAVYTFVDVAVDTFVSSEVQLVPQYDPPSCQHHDRLIGLFYREVVRTWELCLLTYNPSQDLYKKEFVYCYNIIDVAIKRLMNIYVVFHTLAIAF